VRRWAADLASAAERLGGAIEPPSPWLLECADLLPQSGRALDVACGRGRHALLLAAAGFEVTAVDRDAETLRWLDAQARGLGLSVETVVHDLEPPDAEPLLPRPEAGYALVVVFRYLHRPLFPALRRALAPLGCLVYETFTREQARHGHPKNPAYLLERGELFSLLAPLEIVRRREGERSGAFLAGAAARWPRKKPAG
jgi:SAM-dependent methyltransferase